MQAEFLAKQWFRLWESGDYHNLPLTADFTHTSPFGTIEGRDAYLKIVEENDDKFTGQTFEIHDIISGVDKACARYTANQGSEYSLDVSEWFYIQGNRMARIVSYYHIGEIREDRSIGHYG